MTACEVHPPEPVVVVPNRLTTERLCLRPFEQQDLNDVRAMRSHDSVARYLLKPTPSEGEIRQAMDYKVAHTKIEREGDTLVLAVLGAGSSVVIGDVTLTWTSAVHRQAEIGGTFHPQHQGHGLAAEAARALLAVAFDHLKVQRVEGRCHGDNRPSAALCERLGMRLEGHFRRALWVKEEWADELVYALLEDEWRRQPTEPAAAPA